MTSRLLWMLLGALLLAAGYLWLVLRPVRVELAVR